jgi:hypothetical protein
VIYTGSHKNSNYQKVNLDAQVLMQDCKTETTENKKQTNECIKTSH